MGLQHTHRVDKSVLWHTIGFLFRLFHCIFHPLNDIGQKNGETRFSMKDTHLYNPIQLNHCPQCWRTLEGLPCWKGTSLLVEFI